MKILLAVLTIFFHFATVSSCEIEFFPTLIYSKSAKSLQNYSAIKSSNCSENIQQAAEKIIWNGDGRLLGENILEELHSGQLKVETILPKKINVIDIDQYVKSYFLKNYALIIKNYKLLSSNNILRLNTIDVTPKIEWDEKQELKSFNGKLFLEVYQHGPTRIDLGVFEGSFQKMGPALFSLRDINDTQSPLSPNDFVIKEVPLDDSIRAFTDLEHIELYRLNRPLPSNRPLSINDLSKIYAAKQGSVVSIIFLSGQLKVTHKGMALSNGTLGETIRVRLDKKELNGTVIGLNQIEISL